ncbi:MAG: ABC transporter permease [Clostridia bacterium]|nr:ABC transporter permease [Clostridia bacterium]
MLAVFKREFKAYFTTPIGYIILAIFYFFLGFLFVNLYQSGSPDMASLIMSTQLIAVFMIPILTMRLMSEDRRQKVDQALLTSPVRLSGIVLGKFFAALSVYMLCFAPTVIFELITADHIPTLNFFPYFYALLGMFLLGAALIALGMFISSLTESQVVAAILGIVINVFVMLMSTLVSSINVEFIVKIVEKIAFIDAVQGFLNQVVSFSDIIYFISITVVFLFLCVRSLQKRRWA